MTYIEHGADHSEPIPTLASTAHHTVDWDRTRAAARTLRPIRSLSLLALGVVPALLWAEQVATPIAETSVDTAFAAAFLTSGICAVGIATGGRIRRWALSALLVAAVGGTLLAAPTRHLISAWIVGA
ncbi:hypothetical protein ABZZ79_08215 [Streptomyces sp. NPDC006458]|uniref:hypothetical protein n=1 Tax=Streptomyces sp. NPDC006458 TaxID=3154302 RepID=UPI0033A0996A